MKSQFLSISLLFHVPSKHLTQSDTLAPAQYSNGPRHYGDVLRIVTGKIDGTERQVTLWLSFDIHSHRGLQTLA